MTREEIAEKIKLIFRHVAYLPVPYQVPRSSHEADAIDARFLMEVARPQLPFVWTGPRATLLIEHVDVLRALYAHCSADDERAYFKAALLNPFGWGWKGHDERIAQTIAHALIEAGATDTLDAVIFAADERWSAWTRLWHAVRVKLSFEPHWFSESALAALEEATKRMTATLPRGPATIPGFPDIRFVADEAKSVDQRLDAIVDTISRIKYLRLKHELQVGYLPDVDVDRRLLLSRLQELGFPPELEAALTHVDQQLRQAMPFDLKQCMELLRTVLERITERAAEDASAKRGSPLPPTQGPRRFGECNQKLVTLGLLTHHEGEIMQKLANYLAVAGSHSLTSGPEQVRVCRTSVIEWTMMITGRLQQFN